ncbi:MAG: hypothetical protein JXM79_16185 [Sedimentisphaerales bacterium]|nr:hypothetical protein [Sedimentisphaerales bacterium]
MKKYLLLIAVAIIMATPAVSSALTLTKEYLWLFEKDPVTWDVNDNGAWGYMDYRPEYKTFAFWFGALGLEANTDYTLIYYPDPWPGAGLICLGSGTSDSDGRLHISETPNTGDLPKEFDGNYPTRAKIWLVLTTDVDCANQQMVGWQPERYLFEDDASNVTYDDNQDTLDLVKKDPVTWDIVAGAEGKLYFDPSASTFDFSLCACGLKPSSSYTLIYYPDPWPGAGLICLGSKSSNSLGKLSMSGSVETNCDLPIATDVNYPNGAKIWLVLSDDVDCTTQQMIGWNPADYLFEYDLTKFNDTDI